MAANTYGFFSLSLPVPSGSDGAPVRLQASYIGENLFFALRAFCDEAHPLAYADITYGCYGVWCGLMHIPSHIIPLKDGDYLSEISSRLHDNMYVLHLCTYSLAQKHLLLVQPRMNVRLDLGKNTVNNQTLFYFNMTEAF